MSRHDLAAYCGLRRPYNFTRAIPFLLCMGGMLVVLGLVVSWLSGGKLHIGTARFYFALYLLFLFSLSVIVLPFPKLSSIFLTVAIIEILLAGTTHISAHLGLPIQSLLPQNETTEKTLQFKYHPLLMAVPRENFVSKTGLDIRHNSKNMRGQEIKILSEQKRMNVYGGSTTYDLGVPEGATWPEQLERQLEKKWVVANYGVPGYSSVEHVIQTVFYADALGTYPQCAVYYIGWNDIRNAHLPNLDSAYADFHLISQLGNQNLRAHINSNTFSPIANMFVPVANSLLRNVFDSVPYPDDYSALGPVTGSDERLEAIFRRNMQVIALINKERNIRTVFIGQILNPARMSGEGVHWWLPRVRYKDVWALQEHFNQLLKSEADKLNVGSIVLDVRAFDDSDFVDNGHFSIAGSAKFARLIAPGISWLCN